MANYWSKRERLIYRARQLGLHFPGSISDNPLQKLIDDTPATKKQTAFIEELLKQLDRTPPKRMTFGQARRAIAVAVEGLNDHAIRSMGLREGQIRLWEGKYRVLSIYNDLKLRKIRVQEVRLSRKVSEPRAVTKAIGPEKSISPYEMLYLSVELGPRAKAVYDQTTSPLSKPSLPS